jgi:hypothetical protein
MNAGANGGTHRNLSGHSSHTLPRQGSQLPHAHSRDIRDSSLPTRMESGYRAQMAAYRAALSHLTGIPLESVDAVLLLVDTGEACKVRADIV